MALRLLELPGAPPRGGEGAFARTYYDGAMPRVVPALDRLVTDPVLVAGRRWALLANHAAVTSGLEPARAALARAVGPPALLLAPEHGLDGVAQDMEPVEDERDPLTGSPVRSLYGASASSLAPEPEELSGIDVLVVDLPDIGARYYTFAATMELAMRSAQEAGIEVLVLDRPNPLGGVRREGGLVERGFESFVGAIPVPARHGLTLGEIALLLQRDRYPDLQLTVLACQGWRRRMLWRDTGLPWVAPSPNMPTPETALLYPGLCLVEGTELSEGRGTTRPFHLVGAPGIDPFRLAQALRDLRLPGVGFRPARFRPMFGKHAHRICGGVELFVLDPGALRPVELGLALVATVHDLFPDRFAWRERPYEFVTDTPAFDLLTGSDEARRRIDGGLSLEPLLTAWRGQVEEFEGRLEGILLYRE